MIDYRVEYERCRSLVEESLQKFFLQEGPQKPLLEAMRYSLLAGGKRIRPILTVKFCEAVGGNAEEALEFACGVEMLHTYSLIHDDLPCMDDDDLRRGRPSCHKVFGETVATLAGDALQAAAFRTVLRAEGPWLSDSRFGPCAAGAILADAASEMGMCAGQYLDTLEQPGVRTSAQLEQIHMWKTGALLGAACRMGVCAGGGHRPVDPHTLEAAGEYALNLGMAFQIKDDILDLTSSTEVLGKPVGSDRANEKETFVTLFGVETCEGLVRDYTARAKSALAGVFSDTGFLCWLADELAERER